VKSDMGHSVISSAILAAIAALALTACGSRNTFVPPPPPKLVVAQPIQKPVTLYLELTGNTAPFRTANLVARVQGYLESIDYKDGATVTKGTQLFGIERDIYQAQLDQNKAQLAKDQAVLAQAQVNLTRYQTLEQQKSIASQQAEDQAAVVEQDKATIGLDQANVDTATINLGFTNVVAPFDGIVTNHQVDVGNLVGASGPTTLATIVQTDRIYVNFTLSEPQFLTIRRNNAKAGLPISSSDLKYLSTIPIEIGLQDEEGYPHKAISTTSRRKSTPRPARWRCAQFSRTRITRCCRVFSCTSGNRSGISTRRCSREMTRSGRAKKESTCWWSARTMSFNAKLSKPDKGRGSS